MILTSPIDFSNLEIFILLLLGHFLCDFGLQSDRMAIEKCPGKDIIMNWRWWLISHGSIHGFVVAFITGLPLLGLLECILHSIIDLGKCRLKYTLMFDQFLHIFSKIIIIFLFRLII